MHPEGARTAFQGPISVLLHFPKRPLTLTQSPSAPRKQWSANGRVSVKGRGRVARQRRCVRFPGRLFSKLVWLHGSRHAERWLFAPPPNMNYPSARAWLMRLALCLLLTFLYLSTARADLSLIAPGAIWK